MLNGYVKGDAWVFQGFSKSISRVLEGSHKGVKGRYTGISRVYKSLTRMLQGCYKGVTMVLLSFYEDV